MVERGEPLFLDANLLIDLREILARFQQETPAGVGVRDQRELVREVVVMERAAGRAGDFGFRRLPQEREICVEFSERCARNFGLLDQHGARRMERCQLDLDLILLGPERRRAPCEFIDPVAEALWLEVEREHLPARLKPCRRASERIALFP